VNESRCANKNCGHPLRYCGCEGVWISKLNGGLHCNGVLKLRHKPKRKATKRRKGAGA